MFPDLGEAEALERLWRRSSTCCGSTRTTRSPRGASAPTRSSARAERLTERRFDALHFDGPGTDLHVGLLPTSSWQAARFTTVDGIEHMPNLPTEEVFTTPDPQRVDGIVAVDQAARASAGTIVRGLRVRFEGGRAVEIDADESADVAAHDTPSATTAPRGSARSRWSTARAASARSTRSSTTRCSTRTPPATSRSAGLPVHGGRGGRADINEQPIHIDFMIGGPDVDVTGITADGDRVPVLVGGAWQI